MMEAVLPTEEIRRKQKKVVQVNFLEEVLEGNQDIRRWEDEYKPDAKQFITLVPLTSKKPGPMVHFAEDDLEGGIPMRQFEDHYKPNAPVKIIETTSTKPKPKVAQKEVEDSMDSIGQVTLVYAD